MYGRWSGNSFATRPPTLPDSCHPRDIGPLHSSSIFGGRAQQPALFTEDSPCGR